MIVLVFTLSGLAMLGGMHALQKPQSNNKRHTRKVIGEDLPEFTVWKRVK